MNITTVIVNRANFARLFPILEQFKNHKNINNQVVLTGTTLLEEYGSFNQLEVLRDFTIAAEIDIEFGGRSTLSMAKTTAAAIDKFSAYFSQNKPDFLLLIGDRYETLGVAIAASYLNIVIAHIQGGELSGSVDDNIRHAITKLSHIHFTATDRARSIVVQLGEDPNYVFNVGCPAGDYILNRSSEQIQDKRSEAQLLVNYPIQAEPYIIVCYHPTTTMVEKEKQQIQLLIDELNLIDIEKLWVLPNSDAGSNIIQDSLISAGSMNKKFRLLNNIPPKAFIELLDCAKYCIGNSSSFVRDCAFLGTPVLLVGDRQKSRETASNIFPSPIRNPELRNNIDKIQHIKKLPPSYLYGTGNAASEICSILATLATSHIKNFYINAF